MAIIFSEEDLKDIKPPCVIQSFINHNAVLYKVFVVGDSYSVVQRPSIRNFPSGPTGRLLFTNVLQNNISFNDDRFIVLDEYYDKSCCLGMDMK